MNRKVGRQHTVAVVMATSLAVATACSSGNQHAAAPVNAPSPSNATAPPQTPIAPATGAPIDASAPARVGPALTETNGTPDVVTAGATVHFGSTVADGTWSSDGSRIAYVDGHGDIATARPDGTGVVVLTRTDAKLKRAHPTWADDDSQITFAERGTDGVWRLKYVDSATAQSTGGSPNEQSQWGLAAESNNTAPSAVSPPRTAAGPGHAVIAYQHKGAHGPQVWIVDLNQREPTSVLLANGSAPAPSPNGRSVAYVGAGGQLFVKSSTATAKSAGTEVSFGVKDPHDAAWTPDGSRLVFSTAANIESVAVKVAPGVHTNPVKIEASKPGVPAYQPMARGSVNRFGGTDPIGDAVALSKLRWNPFNLPNPHPSQGDGGLSASAVTIVGTSDPAALKIAYLLQGGPVLFTGRDSLDPRVAAEIKRIYGGKVTPSDGRQIQIVGGTDVVSANVAQTLVGLGYQVTRIADADPVAVSVANLYEYGPVMVISDDDMGAIANLSAIERDYHVLLVHGTALSAAAKTALSRLIPGSTVDALGANAQAAVTESWPGKANAKIVNVASTDAQSESLRLGTADEQWLNTAVLVASTNWQGMLIAAGSGYPVVLVTPGGALIGGTRTWLTAKSPTISNVLAFGDASAITQPTLDVATGLVNGPAGSASGALITQS